MVSGHVNAYIARQVYAWQSSLVSLEILLF